MSATPDPIASIRARLAAQIEQAALDVQEVLTQDPIVRMAYQQGGQDKQREIAATISLWRDTLPTDRSHEQARTALDAVVLALEETR